MEGETGWWIISGKIGLYPLARVKGQQHRKNDFSQVLVVCPLMLTVRFMFKLYLGIQVIFYIFLLNNNVFYPYIQS